MELIQNKLLWRKPECLPQKIKENYLLSKKRGSVDIVTSMMMYVVVIVIVLGVFQMTQHMVTAAGVEDALAASNLASAVIDVEEYGKSHIIIINDIKKAFQIYRDALCYNLSLDEELGTTNKELLLNQVNIIQYIVYNVRGEEVEIFICDGNGSVQSQQKAVKGSVFTPDNICVETTTIYSRIGFRVQSLAGKEIYAEQEKSIDIVRYDGE